MEGLACATMQRGRIVEKVHKWWFVSCYTLEDIVRLKKDIQIVATFAKR